MTHNRLLIIEDDYDVAEMLLIYFKAHDYEIIHADSGVEGIEAARSQFPNLILLDVMLPDMDGYDVCVHLRQAALTKYIPILFLTQKDERASKVRGLELGADDYITKPFDVDELRLRVQGSIRRANRENLHEARTGLPTGTLVEEERARRADSQRELVFHIEGFEAYHEVYGFVAANQVMSHTARSIQQVLSDLGQPSDFVGIDGDTFIVLTDTQQAHSVEKTIMDRFNTEITAFYSFLDVDRGGVLIEGGDGQTLVPIMKLVAGATTRSSH